jgi:hypothetical protein
MFFVSFNWKADQKFRKGPMSHRLCATSENIRHHFYNFFKFGANNIYLVY